MAAAELLAVLVTETLKTWIFFAEIADSEMVVVVPVTIVVTRVGVHTSDVMSGGKTMVQG